MVRGFELDAAVQMHDAFPILVIAEGFNRQRKPERFLFDEHDRDLPMRVALLNRRHAFSCNSAQMRALERNTSRQTDLRLQLRPGAVTITTRASGVLRAAQFVHEAPHALVAAGEAVLGKQAPVDGHSIAASAKSQLHGLSVWLAGTGAGTPLWRRNRRRGKSAYFVWLRWVDAGGQLGVGNHLVGRF